MVLALLACGCATQSVQSTIVKSNATPTIAAALAGTPTWAGYCDALAADVCRAVGTCCDGALETDACVGKIVKVCNDPKKFDDLPTAFAAGHLASHATLSKACDANVALLATACDEVASADAVLQCMFAWVDDAALDAPCHSNAPLACAGNTGRCSKHGEAGWICVKARAHGDACGDDRGACVWGLFCPSAGVVVGGDTCMAEGEACPTGGDVAVPCAGGQVCDQGQCVASPGAAHGAACGVDDDCAHDHRCKAGVCVADLCSELQ